MKRSIQWLLCLLGALPATGCVVISPPSITIESVEIVGESDEATSLLFHAMVDNPHAGTLRLLEYDYSVSLGGAPVYHGRHAAEMTLAGGSKRRFTLPAAFPVAASSLDRAGTSKWSMSGSLLFLGEGVLAETLLDMGFRPTTGFSASGQLQWTPPVALAR